MGVRDMIRRRWGFHHHGPTTTTPGTIINGGNGSSLLLVDQAIQELKWGDCDVAIVAGVDILPSSTSSTSTSSGHKEEEKHIIKGEGCVVLILALEPHHHHDGGGSGSSSHGRRYSSPVLGVLSGSYSHLDPRKKGDDNMMKEVVGQSLIKANRQWKEIKYMEGGSCGGGGSSSEEEEEGKEVMVVKGDVSQFIGWLEGTWGLAALIHTLLVLQHQSVINIQVNGVGKK